MTPQGWKKTEGLPPILGGEKVYIIQAPAETIKNYEKYGTGHREITSKTSTSEKL